MELMQLTLAVGLIVTVCKGGVWIVLGAILVNHIESFITLVTRREVLENLTDTGRNNMAMPLLKLIGILFIIIGIATLVIGSMAFIAGLNMQGQNINLKF